MAISEGVQNRDVWVEYALGESKQLVMDVLLNPGSTRHRQTAREKEAQFFLAVYDATFAKVKTDEELGVLIDDVAQLLTEVNGRAKVAENNRYSTNEPQEISAYSPTSEKLMKTIKTTLEPTESFGEPKLKPTDVHYVCDLLNIVGAHYRLNNRRVFNGFNLVI